jgi:hypothetical protein
MLCPRQLAYIEMRTNGGLLNFGPNVLARGLLMAAGDSVATLDDSADDDLSSIFQSGASWLFLITSVS